MGKIKATSLNLTISAKEICGLTECSLKLKTVTDDTRTKASGSGPMHKFMHVEPSGTFSIKVGEEASGKNTLGDLQAMAIAGTKVPVVYRVGTTAICSFQAIVESVDEQMPVESDATASFSLRGVSGPTA